MKIFIDVEFNGFNGELISMALIDMDGLVFYEVLDLPEVVDPWVMENVVPVLNKASVSYERFQKKLEIYLNRYDAVHVIADWPDDISYLMKTLITGPGTRIDTPPLTCEIRRDLDADSDTPHSAIADVRGIRKLYLDLHS